MDKVIPTNGTSAEDIKYANTVKKVYIDGVDVSECCCIENNRCLWTKRYYENNIVPDCEKVKNCYYKQLKRLQEENEQLKEESELLKAEFKNYKTSKENSYKNLQKEWQQCQWDIRKLTTENERLKEDFKDTTDGLLKIQYTLADSCKKYEQALQEIRDIVEEISREKVHNPDIDTILDKINSVIGEE